MFVEDCRSIGLIVQRPDINTSEYLFKDLNHETILYGLGAIKGIGSSLVEKIIEARGKENFKDLYDFCSRVGSNNINKRILTALIGSGAMDCLGKRHEINDQIDSVLKSVEQLAERDESKIQDFFGTTSHFEVKKNSTSKGSYDHISAEWSALGFYLDSHPIENHKEDIRSMCGITISELELESRSQRVAGVLMHLNIRQGKRGRFAFATIDDSSGKLDISIWNEVFDKYRNVMKKGQLIVVEGIIEKDDYLSSPETTKYKMSAERILSFDQARQEYLKHIKVFIDKNNKKIKDITDTIKELPKDNNGSSVLITYSGKKAETDIQLPKDFNLAVTDESIESLRKLCGNENVRLVYHAQPYLH